MTSRLAVIVEAPAAAGNRDLGFWREGMRHALRAAGQRVLVLRPQLAEVALRPAAERELIAVAAPEPRALSVAVDAALRRLAPAIVHGVERGGVLLAALAAQAGGVAHGGTAFVLHARGPQRFREEERGRFPGCPAGLLLEAQERAAARLAPRFIAACPAVAYWLGRAGARRPERVPPLPPPLPPAPREARAHGPWELVVPGPLDGAEGLEFLCAALRRAGPSAAWRVAFLGEPGETAVSEPARLIAALGAACHWRAPEVSTPDGVLAYLIGAPRRALLLGARRAAPPELLAACAAMGVPVVARRSAAMQHWAARHPAVELLPRSERAFAAALGAWAAPARAVEAAPRGSVAPDWLLPAPPPPPAPGYAVSDRAGRFLFHPGRAALSASDLAPLRARLLRAAQRSGAALVTAARAPGAIPLGAEPDTVVLDPGAALGEAVLLDTAADPQGRVAAALGTAELPFAVAEAGLTVLGLPDCWHAALPPPEEGEGGPARRLALAGTTLPPALVDAARLLLPMPWPPREPPPAPPGDARPAAARFADPLAERHAAALERAIWSGPGDRLRRLADLLDALGLWDAAADARAGAARLGAPQPGRGGPGGPLQPLPNAARA